MPCYTPPDMSQFVDVRAFEKVNLELTCTSEQANNFQIQANKLKASLCAICNELDRRGIAENVLAEASRNGLIDLMTFWKDHKANDKARLAHTIHQYSKDEQKIIKDLLKGE